MSSVPKALQLQTFCKCCFNHLSSKDSSVEANDTTCDIFNKFMHPYTIENGLLCVKCNASLLAFNTFQQDIIFKQSSVKRVRTGTSDAIQLQEIPIQNSQLNMSSQRITLQKTTNDAIYKIVSIPLNSVDAPESPKQVKALTELDHHSTPTQIPAANSFLFPTTPLQLPRAFSYSTLIMNSSARRSSSSSDTLSADENPHEGTSDESRFGQKILQSVKLIRKTEPHQSQSNEDNAKKMIKCAFCNIMSYNREQMAEHIEEKHRFPCPRDCGMSLSSKETLLQHMKEMHKLGAKRKKLQTMTLKAFKREHSSSSGEFILPDN